MNIPGIKKIEYIDTDYVNMPMLFDTGLSINTNSYFSAEFTDMKYRKNTASLQQVIYTSNGNKLADITIQFNRSITAANVEELNTLFKKPAVYRITDMDDTQYIIGTQRHRSKITYDLVNDAEATGSKVIKVTITHTSRHGFIEHNENNDYTGGGGFVL